MTVLQGVDSTIFQLYAQNTISYMEAVKIQNTGQIREIDRSAHIVQKKPS